MPMQVQESVSQLVRIAETLGVFLFFFFSQGILTMILHYTLKGLPYD